MTAELLGRIAMFSSYAKAIIDVMLFRPSSLRAAVPVRSRGRESTLSSALRGERGFTMTELMVTVGIAAILTAVAAPPLMSMIAAQRVKTATFDLYSAMSYARSEAIKRNAVVTITPHNGAFTNGYDLVVGGTTLRSQIGSPDVSISAPAGVTLAFDGYGRLTAPARYQMELTSGRVSTTPKRCLVISTTGRPTIQVDNNHDGNCING